jgi:hypothetical protein
MLGIPAYRRYRRIDWSAPSILPLYKHSAYRHIGISVCGYRYFQYINRFLGYREENLGIPSPTKHSAYRHIGISMYIFIYADMPIYPVLGRKKSNNDESSACSPSSLPLCERSALSAYRHIIMPSVSSHGVERIDMRGMPVRQYAGMSADVSTY